MSASGSSGHGGAAVPRLTVIGAGYLGIAHAAGMASLGFEVLCVDTDPRKIDSLASGRLPVYEPGLAALVRAGLASGALAFTTDYAEVAAFGDVHFLCTGTPQQPGGDRADLSQVIGAIDTLGPLLDRRCLVVGKSTVPVGTARVLAARLRDLGSLAELAWNPEFLREGTAVSDTLAPARIVAGVTSPRAARTLRAVYARLIDAGSRFVVTGLETAELAKVAANAFLATKVSFINAMAEVCEVAGADVGSLARILGADPRIGGSYLRPGIGFGGGCLPKDIRAFRARAEELGAGEAVRFLREVDAINLRRRAKIVEMAQQATGGSLADVPVCVLGAAFKPGSDDVRDSPALDVARIMHGLGARVTVTDPAALPNAARACPELRFAPTVSAAARDARIVLLLTEWPEYTALSPADLDKLVCARVIIDGRGGLSPAAWRDAGWDYRAPGLAAAGDITVSPRISL